MKFSKGKTSTMTNATRSQICIEVTLITHEIPINALIFTITISNLLYYFFLNSKIELRKKNK